MFGFLLLLHGARSCGEGCQWWQSSSFTQLYGAFSVRCQKCEARIQRFSRRNSTHAKSIDKNFDGKCVFALPKYWRTWNWYRLLIFYLSREEKSLSANCQTMRMRKTSIELCSMKSEYAFHIQIKRNRLKLRRRRMEGTGLFSFSKFSTSPCGQKDWAHAIYSNSTGPRSKMDSRFRRIIIKNDLPMSLISMRVMPVWTK